MTPAQHYAAAEELTQRAGAVSLDTSEAEVALVLRFAQVHATLATVDNETAHRAAGVKP